MTDTNKEREAFEAWYSDQMRAAGYNADEGIAHLREGNHYGEHRVMLNGKWEGWQARASLSAETEPVAWRYVPSEVWGDAVLTDDPARAERARQNGCLVEPLYLAAPAPAPGWVSVEERLPEAGTPVLLDIGKKFPIRALWAAKHSIEAGPECPDDWAEYDEATDTYYCPEGWYEWNEHDATHWRVTATPRAWITLPTRQGD